MNNIKLLLISNSTNYGHAYLAHIKKPLGDFIKGRAKQILFIPFASVISPFEEYLAKVKHTLSDLPCSVDAIIDPHDSEEKIRNAESIIVGGGNTFQLLKYLQDYRIIEPLREKILSGCPFIGWSAGANIICPSISTTNDMPIVLPQTLFALNIIPFQINPHYTDSSIPNHSGETRPQRISEYVEKNKNINVVGLREGSFVRIENNHIHLYGEGGAKIFHSGKCPTDYESGASLDFLLKQFEA